MIEDLISRYVKNTYKWFPKLKMSILQFEDLRVNLETRDLVTIQMMLLLGLQTVQYL